MQPTQLLNKWRGREAPFVRNSYGGHGKPEGLYIHRGNGRVVLTAPHALWHIRANTPKPPEVGTGGLACLLGDLTSASVLAATGPQKGDAAFDVNHPLKEALEQTLQPSSILLDIHGMKDTWEYDFCIGAGYMPSENGKKLALHIVKKSEEEGFRTALGAPFSGARTTTLSSFANMQGAIGIQIEISFSRRNLKSGVLTLPTVGFLRKCIEEISGECFL